jgi:sporulation protein YlmC with PRC-barrel domain
VIDRGSGRIEHLIVKTGAILGLGGKSVAIPYGAFHWNPANDRFEIASTTEQLKTFPEFSADSWPAMLESSAAKDANVDPATREADPYAASLERSSPVHIEGEVTAVERMRTKGYGEQVLLTISTNDGKTQRVALGPSWYVNSATVAPARGDKVVLDTFTLPRDQDGFLVARELRNGDRDLRLRDQDGRPAWSLKRGDSENDKDRKNAIGRLMLASNLRGERVDCRGNECGKVSDAIFERNSGELAFLSIDPNQNFLGIGDTKRLVPWSVCSPGSDKVVRIDASKEMVVASPETPKDTQAITGAGIANTVYATYHVNTPRFESARTAFVKPAETLDDWSAQGPIVKSIDRDSSVEITGKITKVSQRTVSYGARPAQVIEVQNEKGTKVIVLGPAWYMERQKLDAKVGDTVTVDACKVRIDGKDEWLARSLNHDGSRVVFITTDNVPAWDE